MTPIPSPAPRRSTGFLLGMTMLILGANFVWISYNNVLLPTLVEQVTVQYRGPVVGLIGFFGTLIGVTMSLLTGIVSDHSTSRWGKRTPALLAGPLVGLPFIVLSALFHPPALPIVVIGFFGMQLFTNVGNGGWWPLLVDVVPEHQRGLASGIAGLYALVGAALGIVLVTLLNEHGQADTALWLVAIVFAAGGVISALVMRGHDTSAAQPQHQFSPWSLFKEMFRVHDRVTVFFWVVAGALLANMGLNSLQFFARFFFQTYFPSISPDYGFRLMGGLCLVFTMISALAAGVLSDRIGRRRLILISMFVSGAVTFLMGLVSDFSLFLTLAALRSAATGPIVAVVPALAADLAPEEEAGHYMAYSNLSTGLSGALASLAFGLVLTNMNRGGFLTLFIISAVLFLAGGLVFLLKVPQKELERA